MKIIKPKKLQIGDTIGILAVSGKIKEYERIEKSNRFFEKLGYKVVISKTCKNSHRYMAGKDDSDCIKALHDFFLDENIDAVICARGGFGTLRLLKNINWDIIKNNPKIFAGYSDITVLLNMIFKKTGLVTFHSAMPNGDFSCDINEYTKESFFKTLAGEKKIFFADSPLCYKNGEAKGRIWGGNLATLISLCGLDFIPNGSLILILEDLNEPVYKIDKMLTQLFNIDKIRKNVKGVALGDFQDVDDENMLSDVFSELTKSLNIPVCRGFKFTHGKIKDTIPIGAKAVLNAQKGIISLKENYVSFD